MASYSLYDGFPNEDDRYAPPPVVHHDSYFSPQRHVDHRQVYNNRISPSFFATRRDENIAPLMSYECNAPRHRYETLQRNTDYEAAYDRGSAGYEHVPLYKQSEYDANNRRYNNEVGNIQYENEAGNRYYDNEAGRHYDNENGNRQYYNNNDTDYTYRQSAYNKNYSENNYNENYREF